MFEKFEPWKLASGSLGLVAGFVIYLLLFAQEVDEGLSRLGGGGLPRIAAQGETQGFLSKLFHGRPRLASSEALLA